MADDTSLAIARPPLSDENNGTVPNFAPSDRNIDHHLPVFQNDGCGMQNKKPLSTEEAERINMFSQPRVNQNFPPSQFGSHMYPYGSQTVFPDYDRNFSANFYDRQRWLAPERYSGPAANGGHHWPMPVSASAGNLADEWIMSNENRGNNSVPPWMGTMPFYPPIPGSQFHINRFDLGTLPNGMPYPTNNVGIGNNSGVFSSNATASASAGVQPAGLNIHNESQTCSQGASNTNLSQLTTISDGNTIGKDANSKQPFDANFSMISNERDSNKDAQNCNLNEGSEDYIPNFQTQPKDAAPEAKKKKKRKKPEPSDNANTDEPKPQKKSKKKKTDNNTAETESKSGEKSESTKDGETKPKPKKPRKKKPKADAAKIAEGEKSAEEQRKDAIRKKFYERRNIR